MYATSLVEQATFATERAREYVSSAGGLLSRARSLVAGDALFFAAAPRLDRLHSALASDSVFDKCDAMKRIVAQMCKGNDMHMLFADVVKNIHTPSIELRKLIYLFLVRYAEQCPHEALLGVSALQRDLCDVSLHVRALALRTLCGMRIATIQPVVLLAVRNAATDVAPLVRKTAALALLQIHSASSSDRSLCQDASVCEVLRALLCDRDADVVGAAVLALDTLYPDDDDNDNNDINSHANTTTSTTATSAVAATRYALLDNAYRSLCHTLCSCEECGQVVLLRVLLRYARRRFTNPCQQRQQEAQQQQQQRSKSRTRASSRVADDDTQTASDSDSDATSSSSSSSSHNNNNNNNDDEQPCSRLGTDHALLLRSALPLLHSMSSAVVVGVTALYYHCAPPRYLAYCVKPLLRVLGQCQGGGSSSRHHAHYHDADGRCVIVLRVLLAVLHTQRELVVPYAAHLCLLPHDSVDVRECKLLLLAHVLDHNTIGEWCGELRSYLCSYDTRVVVQTLRALSVLVVRQRACAPVVVRLLTPLLLSCTATSTTASAHKREHDDDNNDDNNEDDSSKVVDDKSKHATSSPPPSQPPLYDAEVMAAAVAVLRVLVAQRHDTRHTARLVFRLMQHSMRGDTPSPTALSTVLWLVGEHIRIHASIAATAPECFRVFACRFAALDRRVKTEVLTLGCKVAVQLAGDGDAALRFRRVYRHVLTLARYDAHYTIRDYARLLESTAHDSDNKSNNNNNNDNEVATAAAAGEHNNVDASPSSSSLASGLRSAFLAHKPAPAAHGASVAMAHDRYELGTLTHALQRTVLSYKPLPSWSAHASSDACRDTATATTATTHDIEDDDSDNDDDSDDDSDDDDTHATSSPSGSSSDESDSDSECSSSSSATSEDERDDDDAHTTTQTRIAATVDTTAAVAAADEDTTA